MRKVVPYPTQQLLNRKLLNTTIQKYTNTIFWIKRTQLGDFIQKLDSTLIYPPHPISKPAQ